MNNETETKVIEEPENTQNTLLEKYLIRVSHRDVRIGGKIDIGLFRYIDIPVRNQVVFLSLTKPGREMPTIISKVPFVRKGTGKVYAVTVYKIRTSRQPKYRIVAKAIGNQD